MSKWVLIEAEDNEILEPDTYGTYDKAYMEMKKRYEKICDEIWYGECNENEARIKNNYAFIDHDAIRISWRIYEVKLRKRYDVNYTDGTGCNDCTMVFFSEEEAENAIEEDLENLKEYYQSLDYDYADFGNKTEFWVKDGDEYACWERMWK